MRLQHRRLRLTTNIRGRLHQTSLNSSFTINTTTSHMFRASFHHFNNSVTNLSRNHIICTRQLFMLRLRFSSQHNMSTNVSIRMTRPHRFTPRNLTSILRVTRMFTIPRSLRQIRLTRPCTRQHLTSRAHLNYFSTCRRSSVCVFVQRSTANFAPRSIHTRDEIAFVATYSATVIIADQLPAKNDT